MKPVLIIKTGEPSARITELHGGFETWISKGLGLPMDRLLVAAVFRGQPLPAPQEVAAAVVTGSAAMVTERLPWSEATAEWIRRAVDEGLALLGICYGHQLLADALGGVVADNPAGREIGTITVHRLPASDDDPLFSGLPRRLVVQATHLQSVRELPPGAVPLAESPKDPHHAFRYGQRAWGVQFHPEFDDTIMCAYLEERSDTLRAEGLDPAALCRATRDPGHGTVLLGRFAELAASR